ncbi:MAG TPA: energy transducer TonB, partial [Pyrinomonadaceae bacterium]|nr:energy transducer TonB [Pyrinomonadaceae bacterium]
TVSMPKNPTTEETTFPFHKMELKARLYLAKSAAGPVLAIASLSGIKSNPAAYTDFARFNSYMDAFKNFFPPKVRTKEVPTKLTFVTNRPYQGHLGRTYKITMGELNGSVHAFATRKRFYAIVSLNTKKEDGVEEKFLSSFVLPERQAEQPKVTASANPGDQPNPEEPTVQRTEADERPLPAEADPNQQPGTAEVKPDPNAPNPGNNPQQPNADRQKKGPINGGMLNGRAIYLPVPEVPPGDASGVVVVAILIDEQGSVVEARAISGPQPLHAAAVNAARLARFTPTMLMGEPVRVSGTLSYNFTKSN